MPGKSNYQVLEAERIKEIVRTARHHHNRDHTPWVHRGEVLGLLALALEHKQDRVIIDGREFLIKYYDVDRAIVRPSNGEFAPCANINITSYLQTWDDYERATRVTRLTDQEPTG